MNAPKATIDFETRSACNLKTHGPWRYSIDPTTQIMCLVWRLPHWAEGRTALWHPAICGLPEHVDLNDIDDLVNWIMNGGLIEAHNVWFEYCIWNNILVPQHGFISIPTVAWRCSAAKAGTHALPRDLSGAAAALGLSQQKDLEGHKLMMKMSKPRKSVKKERTQATITGMTLPKLLWHETNGLFARLTDYCRQDVLTEDALSAALPDLTTKETKIFLLDLFINQKGFQLDKSSVSMALRLIHRETVLLNQELTLLTERKVRKATQRMKMLEWFRSEGLCIEDTQKGTIDELLSSGFDLPGKSRRGLAILRALGRSSTAKYQAMKDWMAKDGRVRGGLLYHGATTGRWSGKGVQPHNFPKGSVKDQEALWALLKHGDRETIQQEYKGVMEALSNGLRGAITASPNHMLYVADYAAIEARVVLWLAQDEKALDIFRQGRDIYCEMAKDIYGRPITKDDKEERALGKIAVLGLGYQMGAAKFQATCAAFNIQIEEMFAKTVVDAYRTKFRKVKELWYDQEAADLECVESRKPLLCGHVIWEYRKPVLYCRLPSGRSLAYPFPKVEVRETSWGAQKPTLTFMGIDAYSRKWKRQHTYGGMIVENITQAVARDVLAEAMLRLDSSEYTMVLTVHDELVAEAPDGAGSVQEYEHMVAKCPSWANGLPTAADAWSGFLYRK